MTTTKVAVSIPAPVLAQAKKEVASGRAKSLSSFVSEAVDEKLRRDDLAAILDEMDAELGPPNRAAKAWAKSVLKRSS
jgi:Arc/MetJ-type ribon-helix-helix transcriptional regulator